MGGSKVANKQTRRRAHRRLTSRMSLLLAPLFVLLLFLSVERQEKRSGQQHKAETVRINCRHAQETSEDPRGARARRAGRLVCLEDALHRATALPSRERWQTVSTPWPEQQ
eukprot:g70786.t1